MSHNAPAKFDLATADTWPNPWPMYRALRDHDPVHHVVPPKHPEQDYYVLSRHADVWSAARDHETFSSAQGLTVNYGDLEMIGLQDNPPFVMQDPPVHTEFRKLVSRGFTPRQVEAVEPKVREFVVERIEKLRADGGGDIVADLFKPLPSMVVAHYLGVPEEDWAQFDGWTQAIVAANTADGGVAGALETVGDAVGSMMAYFTGLIERRRTEPEDDTISHLVSAGVGSKDVAGDISGTLSILAFTFTMVTGGNDTVTGMLGGSMPLLHQRPDQRELLVDKPELIPRRGRGTVAAHLTGAGVGAHGHSRRDHRRHHHPGRSPGAAAVRVGQPRRTPIRAGRRRTRRDPLPAQHPDLQPRRPPLPGCRGGADAIARRADRTAGPLPGFRRRREFDRVGGR